MPHDRQVVADEQQRHAVSFAEFAQQVHDLRLHRDVQCAYGLVADQQPRSHDRGARDRDALALTAAQFVRIAVANAPSSPTSCKDCSTRSRTSCCSAHGLAACSASATLSPAVMRGSRLLNGSWNTTCSCRRNAATGARRRNRPGAPSQRTQPEVARHEPQHDPRQRRFAGARLADDAEPAARWQRQRDVVERVERAGRLPPADAARDGNARRDAVTSQQGTAAHASACSQRLAERSMAGHGASTCPPSTSSSGRTRHAVRICRGQRGANAHPVVTSPGRGGCPAMLSSRADCGPRSRGTAASSARVYGCAGASNSFEHRSALHEPPGVHDRDAVGDRGDDAEIVRDDQDADAPVAHPRAATPGSWPAR